MTATITWSIDWMDSSTQTINGFTEVVLSAGWRCTGNESGQASSVYGSVTFIPPQAGDPNFVPYNQLTQQQVLGWVWASGVNQAATEAAVQTNLNNLINPPVVQNPLPWAQGATK